MKNLLPENGIAVLNHDWFLSVEADRYFAGLLKETPWARDRIKMYGKVVEARRKVAWYGDKGRSYTYSGIRREPLIWTPLLSEIRSRVEKEYGPFNSCLLNLYEDGLAGLGWHSDDEPGLSARIVSVSLGQERLFSFRRKGRQETVDLLLRHGSVLLMDGETQRYWQHCIHKQQMINKPRINLTFRNIEA